MKIIKSIAVKQILTENSKQTLEGRFRTQISNYQKEVEQLRFEKKKFEKTKKAQMGNILQQVEKEIASRKEKCKLLEFQLQQLELLPLGSELKESEVQAIIDINVGDKWEDVVKDRVIVIKDGVISEIR